jgi:hypothetical protein
MTAHKGSIERFLDDEEADKKKLKQRIEDWKVLKGLTQKIGRASTPDIRKQYTQDLYNGVREYWMKYHVKFDFSRQPSEEDL